MYLITRGSLSSRYRSAKSAATNSRSSSRSVSSQGSGVVKAHPPRAGAVRSRPVLAERGQLFRLVLLREGVRQLGEVAVHDRVDPVEREVDPVVGDATLRKIVGADALAAIAAADHALAHRRLLLLPFLPLAVEQARRQHRHRLRAVAVLRAV